MHVMKYFNRSDVEFFAKIFYVSISIGSVCDILNTRNIYEKTSTFTHLAFYKVFYIYTDFGKHVIT